MKTKARTRTLAISVAGILLFSAVLMTTDAFAQARGRSVRMPNVSTGLRGGGGVPLAPHIGGQGLKALGGLLGSGGGGYYGHESHHNGYSNAEAYRDVGLANAGVGLVGTLLGGYSYAPYPVVVAPPVTVLPVPAPYPVAVVSSPRVIVSSYPYGYAPSYYPYSNYYGYGTSYYSYPYSGYYGCGTSYYSPYSYPYGGYGYGRPHCNPPAMGYYPDHHGSQHYDGGYKQSGSWQNGQGGGYGQPGSWQNGHGGMQTPTHQGPGMQAPRSSYRGGAAPSMQAPQSAYRGGSAPSVSGSYGGGRSPQQSGMHPSGQSHRIR